MNTRQFTKFSRRLIKVLGEGTITRLGRTTGFTHRRREVTPHRLAIALLTSLSCHSTQTLADILRVFNALADRSVRYKPFHNQLAKTAFPTFTWHLFDLLLQHLVLRVLAPVPGHALRCFDDILLHDGTSFAVRGRPAGDLSRTVNEDQPRRGGTAYHDASVPGPSHPGPLGTGCRRRALVSAGPRRPAPQAAHGRPGLYGCRLLSAGAPRRGLLHRALPDGDQPGCRPRDGRGA